MFKDKETKRKYDRIYYKNMSDEKKLRKYQLQQKRLNVLKAWMISYKSKLRCIVEGCGENHISCLEFHHIESTKKEISVGDAIRFGWSIERIKKEIRKCIIFCSNCHRKFHYNKKYDIKVA